MKSNYLFTSQRLGFRNWTPNDVDSMHDINADVEVMKYFPSIPTRQETEEFIHRMIKQFNRTGYCYFAVEKLENQELIGFIGLCDQDYEAEFTPCTDVGWRIKRSE